MKYGLILVVLLLSSFKISKYNENFDAFSKDFVDGYKALNIPDLELSYITALQNIKDTTLIQKQVIFFKSISSQLNLFHTEQLSPSQKIDYELIKYETVLNLERLALEQRWNTNKPAEISSKGIITVPNGKEWYKYLLKRWISYDVNPDGIYAFGLKEVARVQAHIEKIRKQTGLSETDFYKNLNDSSFFIKDPIAVQQSFEQTKAIVYANIGKLFNDYVIDDLKIKQGENKALAQTPGYYDDNTFYYNLFDKPYNKRQVDWLFIHEAVPGHHFQASVIAHSKLSSVQQLFFYNGFAEGWGAYSEELGHDLGVYKTAYDELGKWEWDIVRSVRVPLDIALNYYGWTDEQALAFWKKNIRNQDDIAMREIKRLKRWPAQAITYKYGALQIIHWKEEVQKQKGKAFDIKAFHNRILSHGSLPLFLVKENVFAKS